MTIKIVCIDCTRLPSTFLSGNELSDITDWLESVWMWNAVLCNSSNIVMQVVVTLRVRKRAGTLALVLGSMLMLLKRNGSPTTECTLISQKRLELFDDTKWMIHCACLFMPWMPHPAGKICLCNQPHVCCLLAIYLVSETHCVRCLWQISCILRPLDAERKRRNMSAGSKIFGIWLVKSDELENGTWFASSFRYFLLIMLSAWVWLVIYCCCVYLCVSKCVIFSVSKIPPKVTNGFWSNFSEGWVWPKDKLVRFWLQSGCRTRNSGSSAGPDAENFYCPRQLISLSIEDVFSSVFVPLSTFVVTRLFFMVPRRIHRVNFGDWCHSDQMTFLVPHNWLQSTGSIFFYFLIFTED